MKTAILKSGLYPFFLFIVFILMIPDTFGQGKINFFDIRSGWNSYYHLYPQQMFREGEGYKDFKRWEKFWLNRSMNADSSRNGDFNVYRKAMNEYSVNKEKFDKATMIAANWKYIGPTGIHKQIQGLVNAIYIDTVNDNTLKTIYIGTNTSGIWKTTNGGQNWQNITDQSGLSIIGINNITGDPTHGNILYAATGGYFPLSSDAFGIGIIKSTDYGASWQVIYPAPGNS